MTSRPPELQSALAQKYGKMYRVDPRLLLAIGGHETQWGALGAGRQGYTLGYGVPGKGVLQAQYQGVENQYKYAAKTLAQWGARTLADVLGGKASRYAADPRWEAGVAQMYSQIGGGDGAAPMAAAVGVTPSPPGGQPPAPAPGTPLPPPPPASFDPSNLILQQLASGKHIDFLALAAAKSRFQAAPTPTQTPAGPQRALQSVTGALPTQRGTGLVRAAAQQLGQPYRWGGESRKEGGFDCSGLVDYALRQQGYTGPRVTSYTLAKMGTPVKGRPQVGDIIVTHGGRHVVMYAGNGQVIAAPHSGTDVQYQPLSSIKIEAIRRIAPRRV
jgi:cell wall-associated NlpC family hydrolase